MARAFARRREEAGEKTGAKSTVCRAGGTASYHGLVRRSTGEVPNRGRQRRARRSSASPLHAGLGTDVFAWRGGGATGRPRGFHAGLENVPSEPDDDPEPRLYHGRKLGVT